MTVEEIRGCLGGNNEIDRFPIGMRVLAVDDDPTCLKLLDGLLRKCQYQVTTTNQAITALKMLREDRNRFDLIISDVHMPDMDGFKLLELVGLEMDLPVIMLSGNSDPKLVMKGITHGACDYLVKPVRLEELRNVWQHVIRKKVESKSQSKSNNNKSNQGSDGGQESGGGDQNGKVSRKRKDEDEDGEDNENENDDSSTQKKPRVVWSIDLHRKFVAAVNQLGIEKAVPKRILDMMNVEGLTRENVASHLQKYRLYLKRISQQANMVVAFGGNKDTPSYMRMGSLDGDFRSFSSNIMPNSPLSSYSSSGMLARLNSATSMTLHSLASPSLIHSAALPMTQNHQNSNPFQRISSSFDFDHLQKSRQQNTQLANFNSVDESRIFTGSSTFKDPSVTMGMNRSETFNIADQSQSQRSRFSSNTLSMGGNFPGQLPPNDNLKFSFSGNGDFSGNITTTAPVPLEAQSGGCLVALSNQNQKQGQYGQQDYGRYSSNAFNPLSSSAPLNGGSGGLVSRSMDQIGGIYDRSNGGASTLVQCSMRSGEDHLLEQTKLQGEFVANNGYDTLDDLMNGMMKREQDPVNMMEGEFGFDPYAFGSCI